MPDDITINNYKSNAAALIDKLSCKAIKTAEKYSYYNATQSVRDLGISLPKNFTKLKPGVGWASRAVNTLGDRLQFDGFAKDTYGVNELMSSTGANAIFTRSITDALIAGCSFIGIDYVDGSVKLLPFTAKDATGIIDEKTGRLSRGLAVLEWNTDGISEDCWKVVGYSPKRYVLFEKNHTVIFNSGEIESIIDNPTGRPLLSVITHRQSADRPFGKSRLGNTVRRIIDEVGRLKIRYEIAAEFYSTPQRYLTGLANGTIENAKLDSAIGKIWAFTKDEDGDSPNIGQLAQMSINQFSDQKKDLARDFCAETALTLRNLGYETSTPTTAESLSAMSDDLLLAAQQCEVEIGRQFKEIAITMRLLMSGNDIVPDRLNEIEPTWKPIFQLDVGAAGDALYKLFGIMPELKGTITAYKMLGMSIRDAEELAKKAAVTRQSGFMEQETDNE